MAKAPKTFCLVCEKRIEAGVAFCPHCEQPTPWATHDQRVDWEVAQWSRSRASAVQASPAHAPAPVRRRGRTSQRELVAAGSSGSAVAETVAAPSTVVAVPAPAAPALEAVPAPAREPAVAHTSGEPLKVVPRSPVPRKPAPKRVATVRAVAVQTADAPANGSSNGSSHGSTNGSTHGSSNGSSHGSTNGSTNGATPAAPRKLEPVVSSKKPASSPTPALRAVSSDDAPGRKKRATIKTKPVLPAPKVDPSEFVLESEPIAPVAAPKVAKKPAPRKTPARKPAASKRAPSKPAASKRAPSKPAASKRAPSKPVPSKPAGKVQPASRVEQTIDLREGDRTTPSTEQLLEQAIELLLLMNERLGSLERKMQSMNGSVSQVVPEPKRRIRLRRR